MPGRAGAAWHEPTQAFTRSCCASSGPLQRWWWLCEHCLCPAESEQPSAGGVESGAGGWSASGEGGGTEGGCASCSGCSNAQLCAPLPLEPDFSAQIYRADLVR